MIRLHTGAIKHGGFVSVAKVVRYVHCLTACIGKNLLTNVTKRTNIRTLQHLFVP